VESFFAKSSAIGDYVAADIAIICSIKLDQTFE